MREKLYFILVQVDVPILMSNIYVYCICQFYRKTAAQIRRLRESIQAKAFKMNNRPAFYEKRKGIKIVTAQKITEEERLDQENQVSNYNLQLEIPTPTNLIFIC